MTSRILLEVTEFQQSRSLYRHLSGVPRTVMEISRRLLLDDQFEVVCVFYNFEAGAFFEASPSLFDPADDFPLEVAQVGRTRADLTNLLRRAANKFGRAAPTRGAYRMVRRLLATGGGAVPISFSSGDTLLALGAMWGSVDLTDALARAQREHHFRVVSLVYDLIPVRYPQFFSDGFPEQYAHYFDRVIEMSDTLLVISESTSRDVTGYCAEFAVDQPQTKILHLGDGAVSVARRRRPVGAPEGEFVLAVSTLEPRKNHQVLYQAIKYGQRTGMTLPQVVVVGSPGWLTGDLQYTILSDPEMRDAFVWLPRTTDGELAWLYDHALFTVYPSIVEGWGLPIAESLSHGKFCVTCDTSSMPEVGGDLVDYVSPWDPAGWARAIHRYASDPVELAERTERVRREYRPRTWDDAAAAVIAELVADSETQKRRPALDA